MFEKGVTTMDANQRKRWQKKGRVAQYEEVLETGRVHVSLAETHAELLERRGWNDEKTAAMAKRVTALDGLCSARSSTAEDAKNSTRVKGKCTRAAKAFIRALRLALPIVLRDNPAYGITLKAFNAGGRLDSSALKISKYLARIRPFVATLEEPLKPYFDDESPLAELEELKANLDAAETTREIKRGLLPSTTLQLHELNGEILEMIEDLDRIAKIAFADQPVIAARFNKNLIERTHERKTRPAPNASPLPQAA